PKVEVRYRLPGAAGESWWGEQPDWNGSGSAHSVAPGATTEAALSGPIRFTSIDWKEPGRATYDYVRGGPGGKPEVTATVWGHVEAVHVAYGVLYAFRGWPPYKGAPYMEGVEEGPGAVVFVLPEVLRGFEAKDVKTTGGFMRIRGEV